MNLLRTYRKAPFLVAVLLSAVLVGRAIYLFRGGIYGTPGIALAKNAKVKYTRSNLDPPGVWLPKSIILLEARPAYDPQLILFCGEAALSKQDIVQIEAKTTLYNV